MKSTALMGCWLEVIVYEEDVVRCRRNVEWRRGGYPWG